MVQETTIPFFDRLPLVRATRETLKLYPSMSKRQRSLAGLACATTLARPVISVVGNHLLDKSDAHPIVRTTFNVGVHLGDLLDGYLARKGYDAVRRADSTTPIGREADPLGDKITNTLNDRRHVKRDELSPAHFWLRTTRDAWGTIDRANTMAVTEGTANVGARKIGKYATAARTVEDSLMNLGVIGKNNPIHAVTTGLVLVAGVANAIDMRRQRHLHKASDDPRPKQNHLLDDRLVA